MPYTDAMGIPFQVLQVPNLMGKHGRYRRNTIDKVPVVVIEVIPITGTGTGI